MSLTNLSWAAKWYQAHAYRFKQARSVWPCTWGSWYFIHWAGSQLAVVTWASERFLELTLPFQWVFHEYTPVATDTSGNTTNSFYTPPQSVICLLSLRRTYAPHINCIPWCLKPPLPPDILVTKGGKDTFTMNGHFPEKYPPFLTGLWLTSWLV